MKTLISIFLLLLLSLEVHAGNPFIDSLETSLKRKEHDTNRVHSLNELAWQLKQSNSPKAKKYANEAKTLSEKLSFRKGYLTSLNRIGTIAIYDKEFNTAESIYLGILKEEQKDSYTYGIGRACTQLGEIYRNKENYKKALKYSLMALDAFQSINNDASVALISNNLGSIYKQIGDYDKALIYLNKSLEFRKNANDRRGLATSYLNLGAFHISLENYSSALTNLKKAENLFKSLNSQYDLAKVFGNIGTTYHKTSKLDQALEYYSKSKNIKQRLRTANKDPLLFNNIGAIYYDKNNIDSALFYYLKSCEIQENSTEGILLVETYNNIGDILYQKAEYKKALEYYHTALESVVQSKKKISEIQILKNISRCYSNTKQYDLAAQYSSRYIELSDSLDQNYRSAMELDSKFKEQEKKALLLKKDKEIAEANLDRSITNNQLQRNTIIGMIIGFVMVNLLFFTILRARKQKQKTLLAEQNIKVEQQKITDLLKKQELKSLNAMIEGQEEERKRIARDLHDRLGSMLGMVKAHFSSVEENIEELKKSNLIQYQKANSLLDDACQEVRKIAHDMETGVLDKFGLIPALEDLTETLHQSGKIEVEFIAFGIDERLNQNMESTVYRIVQELISNVLKYANAKELTLQLIKANDNLNLTIEDDGVGFDATLSFDGMGLKNVASRVDSLNGVIDIDSRINNGTLITIDIPTPSK